MSGWRRFFRKWLPTDIFVVGHRYSMLSSKSDNPEIMVDEAPDEGGDSNHRTEEVGKKKPGYFILKSLSRETSVFNQSSSTNS